MILQTAVIFFQKHKGAVNDRWLYFKCGAFLLPLSRAPSSEPRGAVTVCTGRCGLFVR